MSLKDGFRSPDGELPVANARVNNLQNLSLDIAIGVLTVVTGVVGSGKSSLIHHAFLRQHPDATKKSKQPDTVGEFFSGTIF